jgi:hypothetical protein
MAIPYFEERMRDVKPGSRVWRRSSQLHGKPLPDSVDREVRADLTNPFKMEGTEDALADHMRIKLLYDLAYCVATEDLRSFLAMEIGIILRTPLVMLRRDRDLSAGMIVAHVLSSLRIGGQETGRAGAGGVGRWMRATASWSVSLAPPPDGPLADAFRARGVGVSRVAKGRASMSDCRCA